MTTDTKTSITGSDLTTFKFIAGFEYGPQAEEVKDKAAMKRLIKAGLVRKTRREGGVICTRRGWALAEEKKVGVYAPKKKAA